MNTDIHSEDKDAILMGIMEETLTNSLNQRTDELRVDPKIEEFELLSEKGSLIEDDPVTKNDVTIKSPTPSPVTNGHIPVDLNETDEMKSVRPETAVLNEKNALNNLTALKPPSGASPRITDLAPMSDDAPKPRAIKKGIIKSESWRGDRNYDRKKSVVEIEEKPGQTHVLPIEQPVSSDEDSDEESTSNSKSKPKVPDGGWGWMVVLSATIISMIGDGTSFSFGLLYIEFLKKYGQSKSKTSWIGSLFMAVPLLLGPVGSALVDRFGCRSMTMLGGIISGTGFILSSVSTSIEQQYLTFGFIAGLGLCLCYVTAVVSVAYWFDKKRTLATSLGSCGTGVGTFVYAPMTSYFLAEYGWRGTILLLSGPFFNLCVCGAVMREPEWWIKEQKKTAAMNSNLNTSPSLSVSMNQSTTTSSDFPGVEEIRKALKDGEHPVYRLTGVNAVIPSRTGGDSTEGKKELKDNDKALFNSVINIPTFIKQNEKVPLEVLETLSENKRVFNVILENYPSLLLCRSVSDHDQLHQVGHPTRIPVTMSMRVKPTKKLTSTAREDSREAGQPLLDSSEPNPTIVKTAEKLSAPRVLTPPRTDSLPLLRRQFSIKEHHPQYLKDFRGHRNSVMYRGAALNIHKYRLRASSCPNIYRNPMTTSAQQRGPRWLEELKELFKGMTDFSMFLELHFLLISLSTILLFTWFIVPYFYLTDFIINQNVMTEAEVTSILSVIGITNTIGMVFLGWAGDYPWMNVTKTYAICLVGCGVTLILMPFFTTNYWAMVFTCAGFGVFFASNFSFTPTILVELIPLERFTTAYGLTLLCQGIGNLLGPPLAGMFYDITNVWDYSFYLAGFWIIISGLLVAFIPATENRRIWGDGELEYQKSEV